MHFSNAFLIFELFLLLILFHKLLTIFLSIVIAIWYIHCINGATHLTTEVYQILQINSSASCELINNGSHGLNKYHGVQYT